MKLARKVWMPALAGTLLLGGLLALAQDVSRPIFRVKVDMVVLGYTVTDSKGRYVNGLKPKDFRILEDGIPQKLNWRISIRKPPGQDMGEFYFGHENPAGITICGADNVYMWMLTRHVEREQFMDEAELYEALKANLAPFGGNAGWIRDNMTPADWINYRPLAAALQPRPWANGRVVLIGDAVHATTPHLASGAGMAVESGIVLAQELAKADSVDAALAAYEERRFERCRDVVETSLAIGKLQLEHGRPDQIAGLIEGALARLNAPF